MINSLTTLPSKSFVFPLLSLGCLLAFVCQTGLSQVVPLVPGAIDPNNTLFNNVNFPSQTNPNSQWFSDWESGRNDPGQWVGLNTPGLQLVHNTPTNVSVNPGGRFNINGVSLTPDEEDLAQSSVAFSTDPVFPYSAAHQHNINTDAANSSLRTWTQASGLTAEAAANGGDLRISFIMGTVEGRSNVNPVQISYALAQLSMSLGGTELMRAQTQGSGFRTDLAGNNGDGIGTISALNGANIIVGNLFAGDPLADQADEVLLSGNTANMLTTFNNNPTNPNFDISTMFPFQQLHRRITIVLPNYTGPDSAELSISTVLSRTANDGNNNAGQGDQINIYGIGIGGPRTSTIPEPSSMGLFALGMFSLLMRRKRLK